MRHPWINLTVLSTLSLLSAHTAADRQARAIEAPVGGGKLFNAPLLGAELDLETIDGIEEVTKLVLIKTDSLPNETHERIDGKYLNSLIETLYTGLRKPFKSVSADILGIFPSLEEVQVRCETNGSKIKDDRSGKIIKRGLPEDAPKEDPAVNLDENERQYEGLEVEDGDTNRSSVEVCKAVTNDCLAIDNLIEILPTTTKTFDQALVRLCPVMLFRIMNRLCHKSGNSKSRNEPMTSYVTEKIRGEYEHIKASPSQNETEVINTLLRKTQDIRKNLPNPDDLSSKKPQRLHKKLKTPTNYKGVGRINSAGLEQQESVDEQLLKIRLILSEPSIEKVWIFSLLFAILSIVVSMGGLIVLPFVKKTTRRRILTLFEGLAVGGLSGSATLHMFPQAFGLVDTNYNRYFWRIFVVFLGIYLCYLCERIIKILKVVRAKKKRRSRASLIDMDFCYGFSSVNREVSRSRSRTSRLIEQSTDFATNTQSSRDKSYKRPVKSSSSEPSRHKHQKKSIKEYLTNSTATEKVRRRSISRKSRLDGSFKGQTGRKISSSISRSANLEESEHEFEVDVNHGGRTRERLVHCLQSVQSQFSPVYAVPTFNPEESPQVKDEPKTGRYMRPFGNNESSKKSRKQSKFMARLRPNKTTTIHTTTSGPMRGEYALIAGRGRRQVSSAGFVPNADLNERLYRVDNVAVGRHEQDNATRISVDTVAWMIVFGDAVLNVIDGLSIGAAFERNILAGISISVAVMLEEVTHRLGTFAVLIRAGMSMQQSLLYTFLSACALFPGLIVGILLSDATEDATPYIFCAAGGIFLYMALVDVMKEMNRSIENAIRKDIKSTLQIFALQNIGIVLAVIFLSFLALYERDMNFEEYQIQYNQPF